ncbi:MAG TPA: response regulator [Holophagaceae bacterium]|nr:response regulator [Holophagaceae bacterium]
MKRVLAVSDDAEFHEFLNQACTLSGGFQVVSARNGWEALTEQRLRPADLALLDFNASSWDGYELLGEIHKDHPDLPIIGLTRTPEVATERRMRNAGAVRMLNRQVRPELLLNELMAMLESPAKGHIEGIHLASLLQVLNWERKNCLVRVQSLGRTGMLYFQRGFLVHADCAGMVGEAVALEILGWEETRVDFLPPLQAERSIHRPLDEILMMAAQIRDEEQFGLEPGIDGGSGSRPDADGLTFGDLAEGAAGFGDTAFT